MEDASTTGGTECEFIDLTNFASITTSLDTSGGLLEASKLAYPGGRDVSGLGNAVYWAPVVDGLWVDLGNGRTFMILILAADMTTRDYLPIAQALAQLAISRL